MNIMFALLDIYDNLLKNWFKILSKLLSCVHAHYLLIALYLKFIGDFNNFKNIDDTLQNDTFITVNQSMKPRSVYKIKNMINNYTRF